MSPSEPLARPPRRSPLRATLLRSELGLMFRRPRTWVLLGVLALMPVALGLAVRFAGGDSGPHGPSFLGQVAGNGVFLAFSGLAVTLPFFLPMTVGVVAGDSLAGEAGLGTLRYLLVAPAGRTRLLFVKLASVVCFCLVAAVTVAAAGLLVGAVLFPLGDVTLLSGDRIGLAAALWRTLLTVLTVGASLVGLAAIGLFVSALADTPIAAMAATVGAAIVCQILDTIPQLAAIHPWLFTHYWMTFADLLRQPMYTADVFTNLGLQALYLAVFGSAAWARLTGRDILA